MKKLLSVFLLLLLLWCSTAATTLADENKDIVRIYLKRLGIQDQLDLKISGDYAIQSAGGTLAPMRNIAVKIYILNNTLYMHANGLTAKLGDAAVIQRLKKTEGMENGLRINNSDNLYTGSLHLSIAENSIMPILHLPVEEYLLGVVPYEMSDSFPLEALKAQAIAARTYAIKHLNPDRNYDLVDTTADQVYKGYNAELKKAAQAIADTAFLCGFDGNEPATCFYSGSNGGQTELPENRWSEKDHIYKMVDDSFDLKNEKSMVKRFTLPKKPDKWELASAQRLLASHLKEYAALAGFDTDYENLRIDEIKQVKLSTPLYKSPSRVMSEIKIKLKFSGKKLLPVDTSKITPTPEPTPTPFIYTFLKTTPEPKPYKNLSDFIPYDREVEITLSVFDDAKKAFGLNLRGGGKEILTLLENSKSYIIEARRFGHGVGMSQRGAEQMGKEGKDYRYILDFYYPGMRIENYTAKKIKIMQESKAEVDENLYQLPPIQTPAPLPTPIPLLWDIPEGIEVVVVSKIEKDSFLNLRQSPSLDSGVVQRLYYGQELVVAEETEDGQWLHVFINKDTPNEAYEGYVVKEFVEPKEK